MEAAKQILAISGFENPLQMEFEDCIRIEVNGHMPLVIEKVAENRISVAHYYTQRGDLMSDPEIVFEIDGDEWIPIRYTQHPLAEEYNKNGLDKLRNGFISQWSQNLEKQGYVKAAKQEGGV